MIAAIEASIGEMRARAGLIAQTVRSWSRPDRTDRDQRDDRGGIAHVAVAAVLMVVGCQQGCVIGCAS